MNIQDLWNQCVDNTNDVTSCLELYTEKIREIFIEKVKNIKNPYPKDVFCGIMKKLLKLGKKRIL
jgi:hypothetical protein